MSAFTDSTILISNNNEINVQSKKKNYEDEIFNFYNSEWLHDYIRSEFENDSKISFNYNFFINELINSHKQKEIHKVLILLSSIQKYSYIPPNIHYIIGCSLLILGRVNGALRELALSIELQTDLEIKEKYICSLINVFKCLGMKNNAIACYGEVISLAKLCLKSGDNSEERFEKIRSRLNKYELGYQKTFKNNYTKSKLLIEIETMSLYEQAKNYINAKGELPHFSFSKDCITIGKNFKESLKRLNEWSKNPKKTLKSDPLNLIFKSIKFMGPLSFFDEIFDNSSLLFSYMNNEMLKYPEIDYSIEPRILVKQLKLWDHNNNSFQLSLGEIMIKHKVILGYVNYYSKFYENAVKHFNWVLDFIKKIEKNTKFHFENNEYLSSITMRIILLFTTQCYCFQPKYSKSKLIHIFTQIVFSDSKSIKNEFLSGRLSKFFTYCGLIYEKSAYSDGYEISVIKNSQTIKALRLHPIHLEEMTRKYVVAAASKLDDDPSVLIIYDRIIWGLLMCGGIHLYTFWFFVSVKNFFFTEFDFKPLHLCPEHNYRIFENNDIIGGYKNGWEIVYKSYEFFNNLTDEERLNSWLMKNINLYLIPRIYEQEDRLLILEDSLEEYPDSETFYFSSKYNIIPKMKSCMKNEKPKNFYENFIKMSKDLVTVWINTFQEHHGYLPENITSYLSSFCSS